MANNMTNMQHQSHPQVVNISTPGNGLDELFKAVMLPNNNTKLPQSLPMRQRNLPASFFRPPSASSSTSHSRESSLDATSPFSPKQNNSAKPPTPIAANSPLSPASPSGASAVITQNGANQVNSTASHATPPPPQSGLTIIHPRARSLPASLQQLNYSVSPVGQSNLVPNNNNNQMVQQQAKISQQNQPNIHIRQHSYDINKIPLPDGWDVSYTPNGEQYFLNHKQQITTWEDPRKMLQLNPNAFAQLSQQTSLQQQVPTYSSQPNIQQVMNQQPKQTQQPFGECNFDPSNSIPLPEGWEQATTTNGDIYYINHNDRSTSWYHPSFPRQLQLKGVQQKQQNSGIAPPPFLFQLQSMNTTANNGNVPTASLNTNGNIPPELVVALENMNTSCQNNNSTDNSANSSLQINNQIRQIQQKQHLRDLELERERLRQRREELMQSSLLKNNFFSMNHSSDPFLSSSDSNHGRQESVDSGLSLGSNITGSHLTLNNCAVNNNNPNDTNLLTDYNQNLTNRMNANSVNTGCNIVDDFLSNALPMTDLDNIDLDTELDIDLLNNVEDMLNTNKDNIMTWL